MLLKATGKVPHEGRVPPMYVAVLAREGAYHVGKQKNRIFTVPYASCKDFADIGRKAGRPLLIDGEIHGSTPAEFTVMPGAFRLLA